jgi:hypothetical protein
MPDRIQLLIDRVDFVTTTESPRDELIEHVPEKGELPITLMIPWPNQNQ